MEGVVGGGEPGDRTKCIGEGAYRGGEERGLNNLHGYFFLSLKKGYNSNYESCHCNKFMQKEN